MAEKATEATNPCPQQYLCIHGHFYQPPREDPFVNQIPQEPGAAPYENFNEKITTECYRPNVELGNFDHVNFDVGPTLAAWFEQHQPDVYRRIVAADRGAWQRDGAGNAMAQAYHHSILPLASARDKRTQIIWGLADFFHRFGRRAEGMWLAETAIDMETLDLLAEEGVRYTILAPSQAAEPVDATEPYAVRLTSGRSISVFFLNGQLSGAASFDDAVTINADRFVAGSLLPLLHGATPAGGTDQLILVATDGELYGHHKPGRDLFLSYLVHVAAPAQGLRVVSLGQYLATHPPVRQVKLRAPSAWSCSHGVSRWSRGCSCTAGHAAWKPALRSALERLSTRLDLIFEQHTAATLIDPWAARNSYILLRSGWMTPDEFWLSQGRRLRRRLWSRSLPEDTRLLLEAQYFGQAMFTSCGWYFEDLDRIEPRNNIAFARRAISLVWQAIGQDLQSAFLSELAAARSWRSARTAADLYLQLPSVAPGRLPRPSAQQGAPGVGVDSALESATARAAAARGRSRQRAGGAAQSGRAT
jgi:hypothetical protein